MLPEVFVDVQGYDGKYKISNHGRMWVKSYTTTSYSEARDSHITTTHGGHFMTQSTNKTTGYVYWGLVKRGEGGRDQSKETGRTAHSLVMQHFGLNKPTEDYVINHIDGDKTNNRIDNLEWLTHRENRLHEAFIREVERRDKHSVMRQLNRWAEKL
jgi:hypothetical protein